MLLAAPGPSEPWQKSQASELDELFDETGENGAPKSMKMDGLFHENG